MASFLVILNFSYVKSLMVEDVLPRDHLSVLVRNADNVSSLKQKIAQLPAVDEVIVVSEEKLKQELERVVSELGELAPTQIETYQYSLLRVYLAKGTRQASIDLMKQYLTRLLGQDRVTISAPIEASLNTSKVSALNHNYLKLIVISLLFFWSMSLVMASSKFGSYCYLIEKFQRKKNVLFKAVSSGMGLIFLLCLVLSIPFSPNILWGALALIASFVVLGLVRRKRRWS